MPVELKLKRKGTGLDLGTIEGKSGANYLVFKTGKGSYHYFVEVEAKTAAFDCGAEKVLPSDNTRKLSKKVFRKKAA